MTQSAKSVVVLIACTALAAGCGSSDDSKSEKGGSTPEATLTFNAGSLTPARLVLPPGPEVTLKIVSKDGRPHVVRVTTGGPRQSVLVKAGATAEIKLKGILPGGAYRVVPDGAAAPALLIGG